LPEEHPRWQSIGARLEEDHHARIVERQVNRLDRTVIDQLYHGRGSDPFDPIPLLKMVLFQYLKGNQSPAT
jgi:transposase